MDNIVSVRIHNWLGKTSESINASHTVPENALYIRSSSVLTHTTEHRNCTHVLSHYSLKLETE
jgi:hypothetical protein